MHISQENFNASLIFFGVLLEVHACLKAMFLLALRRAVVYICGGR